MENKSKGELLNEAFEKYHEAGEMGFGLSYYIMWAMEIYADQQVKEAIEKIKLNETRN